MQWLAVVATSVSPLGTVSGDIVSYLLDYGPIGIGIVLYQMGLIVPKPILIRAWADGEKWRQAFEDERAAHTATREALAVANSRAEAAVEAAKVTTKLLEVVQQQRKDSP